MKQSSSAKIGSDGALPDTHRRGMCDVLQQQGRMHVSLHVKHSIHLHAVVSLVSNGQQVHHGLHHHDCSMRYKISCTEALKASLKSSTNYLHDAWDAWMLVLSGGTLAQCRCIHAQVFMHIVVYPYIMGTLMCGLSNK